MCRLAKRKKKLRQTLLIDIFFINTATCLYYVIFLRRTQNIVVRLWNSWQYLFAYLTVSLHHHYDLKTLLGFQVISYRDRKPINSDNSANFLLFININCVIEILQYLVYNFNWSSLSTWLDSLPKKQMSTMYGIKGGMKTWIHIRCV